MSLSSASVNVSDFLRGKTVSFDPVYLDAPAGAMSTNYLVSCAVFLIGCLRSQAFRLSQIRATQMHQYLFSTR
jgi:hypothetical protein